jgi:hypothetical protein
VQVLAHEAVQEGTHDGALGEDEHFERVGILGGLSISIYRCFLLHLPSLIAPWNARKR